MIPQNLSDEHFRRAARTIDREGIPQRRNSVHYDLVIEGERYPPKYIMSLATKFATGTALPSSHFNAVEAKNYFLSNWYKIVDRRTSTEQFIADEDDESAFPEGTVQFRSHRRLERDAAVARKAKAKRLAETGRLACDVCDLDFAAAYGDVGIGFIEAHHTIPVAMLQGKEKTKISDLALVCSNCHRMLHRGKALFAVAALKALVENRRPN